MGYYSTAKICLNGHCISSRVEGTADMQQKFCDKCGANTITNCPHCNANIRGKYNADGIVALGVPYDVPSYCYNCGSAFPWTQTALDATKEIILEETEFLETEKEKLINSLPDIIAETPKTQLAATRIKKALISASKFTADGIRQFVLDFGCELALKLIGFTE